MLRPPSPNNSYNETWGTWDLDARLSSLCEMNSPTNEQSNGVALSAIVGDQETNGNSVFDL